MLVNTFESYRERLQSLVDTGHLRIHFSQFGEDTVLWTYLQGRPRGFYVDVGSHHPFRYSNTALLAIGRGWTGINIDLDERAIAEFRKERPDDVNLCAAVGSKDGQVDVTMFDDGAVNSLDPLMASDPRWAALHPTPQSVSMKTLRTILNEHLPDGQAIDFLNIDVEGWAVEVLESNDWKKYRPDYIAVEVDNFTLQSPSGHPVFEFLRAQHYNLAGHIFNTSIYEKYR